MSIVIRSGACCSALATAIFPSAAKPTTSISGSADSAVITSRRMTTESSTTSTRTGATSEGERGEPRPQVGGHLGELLHGVLHLAHDLAGGARGRGDARDVEGDLAGAGRRLGDPAAHL